MAEGAKRELRRKVTFRGKKLDFNTCGVAGL